MAKTSGSCLPGQTVPTRAAPQTSGLRDKSEGSGPSLQSAFEDCQLGLSGSTPQWPQKRSSCWNNPSTCHMTYNYDRKVIIIRDVSLCTSDNRKKQECRNYPLPHYGKVWSCFLVGFDRLFVMVQSNIAVQCDKWTFSVEPQIEVSDRFGELLASYSY